ncbi:oligosaccharide flippase family protein [Paraburkholderia nemoris]|uniref:lipopolysaccharide biosynthesis protein n=1 Tax=Paraburkholderia nemoris TaxID=2793076 RepID=UPI0038B7B402
MTTSHTTEKQNALSGHVFLYLLARGLPALVSFGSIVVFARLLGPRAYGYYSLLIVAATTGNVVLFQWLRLSLLRFYPAYQENSQILIAAVLKCFVGLSIFVLSVGAVAVLVVDSSLERWTYFLAAMMCILIAWIELTLELKRAKLQPKLYGATMLVRATLIFIFGIYTLLWNRSAGALLVSTFSAMLVTSVYCMFFWKENRNPRQSVELIKILVRYGLPLTPAFAFNFFLSGFDRFFLGKIAGAAVVGEYAAGADLATQVLGVVLMSINLASYPIIVRAHEKKDMLAVKIGFEKNLLFYLVLSTPLIIVFIFQANLITNILFGNRYGGATPAVISITAISAIFFGLKNGHFDVAFSLAKRTEISLVPNALGAVACVGAHLVLTQHFGAIGAACSSLTGYTVALIASIVLGRRFVEIPRWAPHCTFVLLCAAALATFMLVVGPASNSIRGVIMISGAALIFYVINFLSLRRNPVGVSP